MTGLTWDGLDAMRQELRALPADLANAAAARIWEVANATAGSIAAAYPIGPTGNLRAGVGVALERQGARMRVLVVSRAPHARIYERGTVPRFTSRGAYRGMMPARPTFYPRTRQAVRELEQAAIADLRAAGLQVHAA